jgi:hypothetical protein
VYVDTEMETWGIGLHAASLRIQREFWGNKYRKSAPRISILPLSCHDALHRVDPQNTANLHTIT